MRIEVERARLMALAALYDVAGRSIEGPIAAGIEIRALLAFVHATSNGNREPFDDYWRVIRDPMEREHSEPMRRTLRPTYARTAWNGICLACGIEPNVELLDRIDHWRPKREHSPP